MAESLPTRVLVEACVDSVESSMAAERGGALRLELCDALFDGGTTPSAGMIAACREAVSIPVFVIIRPRGGGFVYSDIEVDVMRRDIVATRERGADGVVIGVLRRDGTVHEDRVRAQVDVAGDMPVTFHRAFDFAPDLSAALSTLESAGVSRVLTSGGAPTAREGVRVGVTRQAGRRSAHGHGRWQCARGERARDRRPDRRARGARAVRRVRRAAPALISNLASECGSHSPLMKRRGGDG